MNLCDLAPQYIRDIAPYQPGKPISELERELGISDIIKLASNENPLGPSPKALQALRAILDDLALYPDGNGFELKQALAAKFAVGMEQIVLGNGSNDVLELAARTFLTPSSSAVYSQHAFLVYPLVVQAMGAAGIVTPALDYGHDLDAMAAAVRADTRIVFIANPNNPTGSFLSQDKLRVFLKKVPSTVLVVLDEAYTEYLELGDRYNSIAWLSEFPNLLVTRTFSKAFGLAGLRVGFAIGQRDVADLINRVRQPFNVNSLALAAAQAALGDEEFLQQSRTLNRAGLQQLSAGFDQLRLSYIPSYGNFISVEVGDAAAVYQRLLKQGVIVRPIAGYAMPQHLRVTVGTAAQNQRFLSALAQALHR